MTALDRDYVNLDAGSRLKVSPLNYSLEGLGQEASSLQISKSEVFHARAPAITHYLFLPIADLWKQYRET